MHFQRMTKGSIKVQAEAVDLRHMADDTSQSAKVTMDIYYARVMYHSPEKIADRVNTSFIVEPSSLPSGEKS